MTWQRTTGKNAGTYLRSGPYQLYVKRAGARWDWFLDGMFGGDERSERAAQAAADLAVRSMSQTHTGRMAAAAA